MIELVPSNPQYADLWQKWRSEPITVRFNPIAVVSLEKLKERMALMSSDLSNLKAAEEFQFFIQSSGKLVGTVTLKNISHMMMYGEIGYDVGQDFQGKGIGTQAVRSFVTKVFSETSIRRLIAYVAEENLPSCKLLEKIGFLKEGVCREHYIINGKPTNEVLYGILRSDLE
jgi:[ribosomal protein S5]-alanine N-acetyltransferase